MITPIKTNMQRKDDPRLWFDTTTPTFNTDATNDFSEEWDPRPQSPAQQISLTMLSKFKSMLKNVYLSMF